MRNSICFVRIALIKTERVIRLGTLLGSFDSGNESIPFYFMLSDWLKILKPGAVCATNQMKAKTKSRLGRTRFPALFFCYVFCFVFSLVHYFVCACFDWQLLAFVLVLETLILPCSYLLYRRSFVKRAIRHYPKIQEILQYASECAVCGQSFLNTWLECVHFVDARKVRYKFDFIWWNYLHHTQGL